MSQIVTQPGTNGGAAGGAPGAHASTHQSGGTDPLLASPAITGIATFDRLIATATSGGTVITASSFGGSTAIQGTGGPSGGSGVQGIASAGVAGISGVRGLGNVGAATGVAGTGGPTAGDGVRGTGGTDGAGVRGTGTGIGAGVIGVGGATGYGVQAQADTTSPARAAMRIVPQDTAPTIALKGDVYFDDVLNKLRIYSGVAWETVTSL